MMLLDSILSLAVAVAMLLFVVVFAGFIHKGTKVVSSGPAPRTTVPVPGHTLTPLKNLYHIPRCHCGVRGASIYSQIIAWLLLLLDWSQDMMISENGDFFATYDRAKSVLSSSPLPLRKRKKGGNDVDGVIDKELAKRPGLLMIPPRIYYGLRKMISLEFCIKSISVIVVSLVALATLFQQSSLRLGNNIIW